MSSPHFADFTYVRFALGNITDGTDELRARPLANQKAFGFPRETNRHYDQHDPDQDRTRAVPPRTACDQRSSDSGSRDRKSVVSGKSGSVRVDLGGGRIIKKKK